MKQFIKRLSAIITLAINVFSVHSQIGYQVSLLNNASGEPRANESVTVTVTITNSEGGVVCTETKTETTNDFGVLSMTVGSDEVFAATDWSKLPFFISATVDGVLIGRSQLLSVPVAECAKTLPSCENIIRSKKWEYTNSTGYIRKSFLFGANNKVTVSYIEGGEYVIHDERKYYIQGNIIAIEGFGMVMYIPENNAIYSGEVYK